MSHIETDAKKTIADAGAAVTVERRRLAVFVLDGLRAHPRTLLAIVAALAIVVVALVVMRG